MPLGCLFAFFLSLLARADRLPHNSAVETNEQKLQLQCRKEFSLRESVSGPRTPESLLANGQGRRKLHCRRLVVSARRPSPRLAQQTQPGTITTSRIRGEGTEEGSMIQVEACAGI